MRRRSRDIGVVWLGMLRLLALTADRPRIRRATHHVVLPTVALVGIITVGTSGLRFLAGG